MSKIFYDFEFHAVGSCVEPISLGLVSESGEQLYLINSDYDWNNTSEWLAANVFPNLFTTNEHQVDVSIKAWADLLSDWIRCCNKYAESKVELIGYYSDYDHVCFGGIWGDMNNLPSYIPMLTKDLKQWMDDLSITKEDNPIPQDDKHNALADALWNKKVWEWLTSNYDHPAWSF